MGLDLPLPVLYPTWPYWELLGWEQTLPSLCLSMWHTKKIGKKKLEKLGVKARTSDSFPNVFPVGYPKAKWRCDRSTHPGKPIPPQPPSFVVYLCPGPAQRWPGCRQWWCSSSGGPGTGAGTPGCPASPLQPRWAWSQCSCGRSGAAWGRDRGWSHKGWAGTQGSCTADLVQGTCKGQRTAWGSGNQQALMALPPAPPPISRGNLKSQGEPIVKGDKVLKNRDFLRKQESSYWIAVMWKGLLHLKMP